MRTSLVICLAIAGVVVASECHWASNRGASFDLQALTRVGGDYRARDLVDSSTRNFTYHFNLCANVSKPVRSCDTEVAPAFQVGVNDDSCYRLASPSLPPAWALIDPEDPSRGVQLNYVGGQSCGSGGAPARSLSVQVYCDAAAVVAVPTTTPVEEKSTCAYNVQLSSIFGCPSECPIVQNRVCRGNGVCRYDVDNRRARCFCYDGYSGDSCEPVTRLSEPDDSAIFALLVVVSVLLVVVFGALNFVWFRVRSLRLDPAAYQTLAGTAEVHTTQL